MVVIKHALMWMVHIHAVAERDISFKLMIEAVQVKCKILNNYVRIYIIVRF